MRTYLSGPITGNSTYRDDFARAEKIVAERGEEPVNPLHVPAACNDSSCLERGGPADEHDGGTLHSWECYLRGDLAALMTCDKVALLPGWEKSKGATLEQFVARTVNIEVEELRQ
jgi:hypothetical protein